MRIARVLLYGAAAALMLIGFTQIPSMIKYVLSLLTLLLCVRFFRVEESMGMRIGFGAAVLVLFVVFTGIYVGLALQYGWPIAGNLS